MSRDLFAALRGGVDLPDVVPLVLDRLEAEPLASAGWFPGDLLRALLELPGSFWARHPRSWVRFREALRAGAAARRRLPVESRVLFWTAPLPATAAYAEDHRAIDDGRRRTSASTSSGG